MNVLFLTLLNIYDINEHTIYTDLLREFIQHGENVYIVSPAEKRLNEKTRVISFSSCQILKPKIGNIQKTNNIEKGISTITLQYSLQQSIKKYWADVTFDLIIYSTPPITLTNVVSKLKKRDNAKTYLLLKDIFPQNAVDIGMMRKFGVKGILYHYFRKKEKKLYDISDKIGCMSQANVNYVLQHNDNVHPQNVEVCPNCIEPCDSSISKSERLDMRKKYGIPLDKKVLVYGGNLGKPQDIQFVVKCLSAMQGKPNTFFLIAGNGTDYPILEKYIQEQNPVYVKLMKWIPRDDYDKLVAACDIGLIFLDHRFTIPNFPSRLLSYMQAKLPVLACTDRNTDIGSVIQKGKFGVWCESDDPSAFANAVEKLVSEDLTEIGMNAYQYLLEHYSAHKVFERMLEANEGFNN